MRVYNKISFVIVGSLLIILFMGPRKCSSSSEIALYECPCEDSVGNDCKRNPSSPNIWTTLNFLVGNDTKKIAVRLLPGHPTPCESEPSEKILVTFINDEHNEYGGDGHLHGNLDNGENIDFDINPQGVLSLHSIYVGLEQYNPESFCIRRLNASHSSVEICCGREKKSCIQKCCPYGYVFSNDENNPCIPDNDEFVGWSLPMIAGQISSTSKASKQALRIRTGFPNCEVVPDSNFTPVVFSTALTKFALPRPRRPFRLLQDGTIQFLVGGRSTTSWKTKSENVIYCVDRLSVPHDQLDMTCGEDEQDVLIMCTKEHVKKIAKDDWIYRIVYMTGIVIAIIVLLATAVVHFLLWEKQNIHAWTILCYVITLTCFYACLLIIYVDETRKRKQHNPLLTKSFCFALGVITHFMGIFSFSWLSVINFDLWWTFRVLKPMNQRSLDVKRLVCYGSFALAVPTCVVSIAAAFQISYEKRSEPCRKSGENPTIYPLYGEDGCFLANSSQPYYFYVPVGVLLLANLIFYMCTSCQMLRIYNATRNISDRNTRKQKQSCELFLKLFLVMGTTWIFQVILSMVQTDEPFSPWYTLFFAVLDLVNMLQAIAIFVIFVCKRETLRSLEQKYFCLKSCLHPFSGFYRTPTVISRSTDGSTKISRTDFTKNSFVEHGSDHRRDSELISFS